MSTLITVDVLAALNRSHARATQLLNAGHASEPTVRKIKIQQLKHAENEFLLSVKTLLQKYNDAWISALSAKEESGIVEEYAELRDTLK